MISFRMPVRFSILFCLISLAAAANGQNLPKKVAAAEYPDANCLRLNRTERIVIRDEAAFLEAVGNDNSRRACLEKLPAVDFNKEFLAGIILSTGYCRRPALLESGVTFDSEKRLYNIDISYLEPNGTCRALSRYDLWLRVPRSGDDFEVVFNVREIPRDKSPGY